MSKIELSKDVQGYEIPEWLLKTIARLFFIPLSTVLLLSTVIIFVIQLIVWLPQIILTGQLCLVISSKYLDWILEDVLDPYHTYCSFKDTVCINNDTW